MNDTFDYGIYGEGYNLKASQIKSLRRTASFIGIAVIMIALMGKVSGIISLKLMNLFGAGIYVQNGTFYGGELEFWILNMLSSVLVMLIPAALLYFALGAPFRLRSIFKAPNSFDLTVSVPITLSATVLMGIVLSVLDSLFRTAGVESSPPDYPQAQAPAMIVMYIIYMTVIPAFFEELMFRGVIMTSLRRYGDTFAVVASAALFGLVHGNALQFVNAFALGLLLGYFAVRSGSVITSMVIHFFNNLLMCVLELAAKSLSGEAIYALSLFINALLIVCGLIALMLYCVKNKNRLRLISLPLAITRNEKIGHTFTSLGMLAAVLYFVSRIVLNFSAV